MCFVWWLRLLRVQVCLGWWKFHFSHKVVIFFPITVSNKRERKCLSPKNKNDEASQTPDEREAVK
jgi:hypothetical protein